MSIRGFMGQVRSGRIAQLKAVGGLGTCGCCFDDELLPEDQLIQIGGANIYKFFRILPQKISMASDSVRITPQIELERDMCEWMVGHDLSMFDIKKGQMFCFVCYSCPMVEAMPIAHSYPEAWSRRNSDVAQPRAMAFVSHVSPGGNYVTMSDCDTRGSNFFRTFSSTKIYGFLRGKGW